MQRHLLQWLLRNVKLIEVETVFFVLAMQILICCEQPGTPIASLNPWLMCLSCLKKL